MFDPHPLRFAIVTAAMTCTLLASAAPDAFA